MERTWDIEPTNDPKIIQERLNAGPQLCMFINKDATPEQIYNLVEKHYLYGIVDDAGEDRLINLIGAYKGKIQEDKQKTKKVFGKEIKHQVFDDLIHVNETPYVPFCKDLEPNIIDTIQKIYDVQNIEWKLEYRKAILCYYYDQKNVPKREGRVISQTAPISIQV